MSSVAAAGTAAGQTATAAATHVATERPAVSFTNLVLRLENEDDIGVASEGYRIFILEAMRKAGLRAVGGEDLVFGKDHSAKADFLLGGTVHELQCHDKHFDPRACRVGIDWELLDVRTDKVVYRKTARFALLAISPDVQKTLGRRLVLGALGRVLGAQAFLSALTPRSKPSALQPQYGAATFTKCATTTIDMQSAANDALDATAIVEAHGSFGSGFFVSNDGLLLTAAHVADEPTLTVKLRDGSALRAHVVRIEKNVDAALLRVDDPLPAGRAPHCLPLGLEPKVTGAELYAMGAPVAKDLGFSLTRGILSGVREIDGVRFLQTDASLNHGNSGGPLVDAHGRVLGIVSWKAVATSVEGLGFAVPIEDALRGLGLTEANETALALLQPTAATSSPQLAAADETFVDTADATPSIDPEGDKRRAAAQKEAKLDALTPWYVKPLRYAGGFFAITGAITIVATADKYDSAATPRKAYENLRLGNDLAWVATVVGVSAFVASFVLAPAAPSEHEAAKPAGASVALTVSPLGAIQLSGRY
ncbi:MAG TPA: serine protease [Polyangiales bacterium]